MVVVFIGKVTSFPLSKISKHENNSDSHPAGNEKKYCTFLLFIFVLIVGFVISFLYIICLFINDSIGTSECSRNMHTL